MVRSAKLPALVVCAGLAGIALAAPPQVGLPGAPSVATAASRSGGPVDRAIALLQSAQRPGGGFATTASGSGSDPATSVWAALALASVGINPADQPRRGPTALDYLTAQAPKLTATGDLARLLIVLRAAGPAGEATASSVATTLAGRQRDDGGFPDGADGPSRVAATAFATIALTGNAAAPTVAPRAVAWLRTARAGGGWGPTPGSAAQAGLTGLALQAVHAAAPDEFAMPTAAQSFLRGRGNADGGLGAARPATSDAVATAWAMQGLRASGVDPKTYEGLDGGTPGAFLAKQQHDDGGFGSVARTAQVLAGLNGSPFPLGAVASGSRKASERARRAPAPKRTDGATGGATSPTTSLSDAQAGASGSSSSAGTTAGGSSSGGSASSATGSSGATSPSSATSTPSGSTASSSGTTTATTPGAPTTTPSAAAPPTTPKAPRSTARAKSTASSGDQVSGVVVGAQKTAAAAPAGLAGGGAADDDGGSLPTAALGGALLAVVLVGTQVERRRPRRVLS